MKAPRVPSGRDELTRVRGEPEANPSAARGCRSGERGIDPRRPPWQRDLTQLRLGRMEPVVPPEPPLNSEGHARRRAVRESAERPVTGRIRWASTSERA